MMADEQRAVLDAVLAAAHAGDARAQAAWYTDDAVLEFPYADPPVRVDGRQAIADRLAGAFTVFRVALEVETLYHVDGSTAIVEATGTGEHLPTGATFANRYVIVLHFAGGRICAQREYFNPVPVQRALGT